jgi:hypothetical protein
LIRLFPATSETFAKLFSLHKSLGAFAARWEAAPFPLGSPRAL